MNLTGLVKHHNHQRHSQTVGQNYYNTKPKCYTISEYSWDVYDGIIYASCQYNTARIFP